MDTLVFERDDRIYMVGPVAPIQPRDSDIEEFAFSDVVRQQSPNELLLWFRGQYVEADRPNSNGQLWTTDELSIASLTPKLMPVTVMHDPKTAVGLIAHAKMLTPAVDNVPRARIDTALALWRHRFPDVCEEAMQDYGRGTLMQSQECIPSHYSCVECGQSFVKLPSGAERSNWCEHLRGETSVSGGRPVRRLEGVTFTGTGLIFGSRGARGALDTAHLESFREEVAHFHEEVAERANKPKRRPRRMDTIEIPRDEYDRLKAASRTVDELSQRIGTLEENAAKVPELERQVDALELDKKKVEGELAEERSRREGLEETARAQTLSGDRLGKLGEPFKSKLTERIRAKLEEQAKSFSDEEWSARIEELEELTDVKADAAAPPAGDTPATFSREEQSRAGGLGGGGGELPAQTAAARSAVLGGLFQSMAPAKRDPARTAGQ